ncbi:MAG: RNA polymerase sigma factor [Actinomycetota bacterium]|nr:RNA polymerase sigma factor [Actinomycetota bacterium]
MARDRVLVWSRHACAPLGDAIRERLAVDLGDDVVLEPADVRPVPWSVAAFRRALRRVAVVVVVVDRGFHAALAASGRERTELAVCLAAEPDLTVVPVLVGDAGPATVDGRIGPLAPLRRWEPHALRLGHLDADLGPLVDLLRSRLAAASSADADDTPRPLDDDEVLERILAHAARTDSLAFARLYRQYLPKIHAFVYRRSRSREVAEDITAATFEKAYRQLQASQSKAGGFGPWLYRIASNELADHYRRVGRTKSDRGQKAMGALHAWYAVNDIEHDEIGSDLAADREVVLVAMAKLNPRYQEALSLRYLEGRPLDDAAAAMGTSVPVAAVTLRRALKALRREIDRLAAGDDHGGRNAGPDDTGDDEAGESGTA